MKVKATEKCEFDGHIRREDEVFETSRTELPRWIEPVEPAKAKPPTKAELYTRLKDAGEETLKKIGITELKPVKSYTGEELANMVAALDGLE